MVSSLNTKVDLTIPATFLMGLTKYGNVMIGDKAFEFYNERNVTDNIQIPWNEIDRIEGSVVLKGKKISRFAIFKKDGSYYTFSTRDNKKTLRACNLYIPSEKLVRAWSAIDVLNNKFHKKNKSF